MMYDFEYNNIMDYWSKEFHIHISTENRNSIIRLYEMGLKHKPKLDFNFLCHHMMLQVYLTTKYPELELFDSVFSKWAMN